MSIVWLSSMELGHAGIDRDHKTVLGIIRNCDLALRDGRQADAAAAMADLRVEVAAHFAREIDLMSEAHYDRTEEHAQGHRRGLAEIEGMVEAARQGRLAADAMQGLIDTFARRLFFDDAHFVNFLNR
ncbi:hemerythrin domain-containing protein [Magnetospirillum sp. UT-4]|uniref:hemerythrin domain-containing protein n=1 Tax=Magnetospirillum sp. UT-4 TaxID=2681467 RepID=UPI00137DDF81|nr:hemerythrin domain-containing protein [Magnetospirillum sp. UT-4]CAA7620520.1 hypothetical protein MTBUT4_360031 [Magnetospirillum sp. UT-4]